MVMSAEKTTEVSVQVNPELDMHAQANVLGQTMISIARRRGTSRRLIDGMVFNTWTNLTTQLPESEVAKQALYWREPRRTVASDVTNMISCIHRMLDRGGNPAVNAEATIKILTVQIPATLKETRAGRIRW